MKIRFYVNEENARARVAALELAALARSMGLAVAQGAEAADVVIALGGDGTILRAVHTHLATPVLGFNLGSLGYLASVGERDFGAALEMLAKGRYRVADRSLLEARRAGSDADGAALALNEIVVMREMTGHAAALDLLADGKRVTRYSADGLVVATSTGSTAYSLAAGGPVLMPDSASFVVTPMNPHALGVRPLVVSDRVRLEVVSRRRVNGKAEKIGVYADGEGVFLLGGDEGVAIRRAQACARFVELAGYDPYDVLSHKLGWSGSGIGRQGA